MVWSRNHAGWLDLRSAMALSQAAMGTTASKARSEGRNDRCCSSGSSAGRREIPWQGSDQSRLLKGKSRTHHRACRAGDKVPGVALAGVLGALQAQGVPSGCGGGTRHPHPLPQGTAKGQRSPCPLHPAGTHTALGIKGAASPGWEDSEQELG